MYCSNCKTVSIRLPHYDSYICEFGHVICGHCVGKIKTCVLCDGKIVHQSELRVEGIAKTILKEPDFRFQAGTSCSDEFTLDSDRSESIISDNSLNSNFMESEVQTALKNLKEKNDEIYKNYQFDEKRSQYADSYDFNVNRNDVQILDVVPRSFQCTESEQALDREMEENHKYDLPIPIEIYENTKETFYQNQKGYIPPNFDPQLNYYQRMSAFNEFNNAVRHVKNYHNNKTLKPEIRNIEKPIAAPRRRFLKPKIHRENMEIKRESVFGKKLDQNSLKSDKPKSHESNTINFQKIEDIISQEIDEAFDQISNFNASETDEDFTEPLKENLKEKLFYKIVSSLSLRKLSSENLALENGKVSKDSAERLLVPEKSLNLIGDSNLNKNLTEERIDKNSMEKINRKIIEDVENYNTKSFAEIQRKEEYFQDFHPFASQVEKDVYYCLKTPIDDFVITKATKNQSREMEFQLQATVENLAREFFDEKKECEKDGMNSPPLSRMHLIKVFKEDFDSKSHEDISKFFSPHHENKKLISKENLPKIDDPEFVSNEKISAWRAYNHNNELSKDNPMEKFKKICPNVCKKGITCNHNSKNYRKNRIVSADELQIARNPVFCPITFCNKRICISELSKHVHINHSRIPLEVISPGICKNLSLDPKINKNGISKCNFLYLVNEKIHDLSNNKYKDFVPVLLMSTKVSLMELISSEYKSDNKKNDESKQQFQMIWLTGLNLENLPINFTLSICSGTAGCHIVHSGPIHSLRMPQDVRALYQQGHGMLLSEEQCLVLTNQGHDMIEAQLMIY